LQAFFTLPKYIFGSTMIMSAFFHMRFPLKLLKKLHEGYEYSLYGNII